MQTDQVSSTISIQTLDEIRKVLRKTWGWLAFLAVISIGQAVLSIVFLFIRLQGGILNILIELASSALGIALAVFLFQASQRAKRYAESGTADELTAYHGKLKIYFTLTSLLVLIGLVAAVLMGLIGSCAGLRG